MTGAELRAWIKARYRSIRAAAPDFGLTYTGLLMQCTGHRPVSRQTARIVALIEAGERDSGRSH
jgi:hypothetical protein